MNLLLHGLGNEKNIAAGSDSLAAKPSVNYDMVLTNPPFGKKSSVTIINQGHRGHPPHGSPPLRKDIKES